MQSKAGRLVIYLLKRERKKEKERRMQWIKRFISWLQDCYFQWELASMLVVMDPVEKYFFRILLSTCKHRFFKHRWMYEIILMVFVHYNTDMEYIKWNGKSSAYRVMKSIMKLQYITVLCLKLLYNQYHFSIVTLKCPTSTVHTMHLTVTEYHSFISLNWLNIISFMAFNSSAI